MLVNDEVVSVIMLSEEIDTLPSPPAINEFISVRKTFSLATSVTSNGILAREHNPAFLVGLILSCCYSLM